MGLAARIEIVALEPDRCPGFFGRGAFVLGSLGRMFQQAQGMGR